MTPNNQHNIMTQLVQEQKSLWRIEKHYLGEAETDEERSFWQGLADEKKTQIERLKVLLKQGL